METYPLRKQMFFVLLWYVLVVTVVPHGELNGDLLYWQRWATAIFEHGLGNVYAVEDNNYNPFYHYVLWLFGKLMGSVEKVNHYIDQLRIITLLFDIAGAFWAASLVREPERRFGLVMLLLLNIGYIYNSLIWVQVDAIYTLFIFGAVVLAVRQQLVGSVVLFTLGILAKTQAIIFLPALLLLWAPLGWRRPIRLLQASGTGALLALLAVAPFIWSGDKNYLPRIIDINFAAVDYYPKVSMNAFNIWYLLHVGENPVDISDAGPYAGLTYHRWGLLLFLLAAIIVLWPLLLATVRQFRLGPGLVGTAASGFSLPLVLLSAGTVPLIFTYFNTQMHERYWHAAVLFLAAYGFISRDYWPYVLVSVAYFLNMEWVLRHLKMLKYPMIFHPVFIASLFGVVIVLCIAKLYRLLSQPAEARVQHSVVQTP